MSTWRAKHQVNKLDVHKSLWSINGKKARGDYFSSPNIMAHLVYGGKGGLHGFPFLWKDYRIYLVDIKYHFLEAQQRKSKVSIHYT